MKKPNFFILGAPKCGTTSLVRWLSEHPNIFIPFLKEPHYFNFDGLRGTKTLEEYELLFQDAKPHHIAVGEGSTNYLFSRVAVPKILEYNPEAKFIVSIRNPVEMAPALHAEEVWQGREDVLDFEKAWRLQEARREGKFLSKAAQKYPQRLQYGPYCRLGEQLQRLFSIVPRDRVLVLVLDDIAENPRREYLKVLEFLGVPDDGRTEFPVYNRRKAPRSRLISHILLFLSANDFTRRVGIRYPKLVRIARWLRKVNWEPVQPKPLSPKMRAELVEYFKEDIHLLEDLLQRDFSHWLKVEPS